VNRRRVIGSVRLRITVLATLAMAIGLLIGAAALLSGLRSALLDAQAGTAPRRAAELAADASRAPLPVVLPALDTDRLTLLQVLDGGGRVKAASAQLQNLPALVPTTSRQRRVLHDIDGLGDGAWLAEATPATIGGRVSTVVVLTSLNDYERSADLLRHSMLVGVPVLVALVGFVVWIVVGRALRPVESMRAEVEHITAARLDRRVPVPATRDEVGKLGNTLNDMLDRLQVSSNAQRRFAADASHELRTPIANIRAAMEVAVAHPDKADWPALAADVLHQDGRMERLTVDLLSMARGDSGEAPLQLTDVDLAGLVRAELLRPIDADRELRSGGEIPPLTVVGDREALVRLLSNLVDNALRHAHHTVTVTLAAGLDTAELRVADDGPGVAPADRERIFDPFVRLDAHRARSVGGSGLGLAIARQVVQAHHGSIRVLDGPGATFVVRIPLNRRDPSATPGSQ
jgi:signal transduction histidine kinase